jgi:hypothetical protein
MGIEKNPRKLKSNLHLDDAIKNDYLSHLYQTSQPINHR